jgi:hypothetical protein
VELTSLVTNVYMRAVERIVSFVYGCVLLETLLCLPEKKIRVYRHKRMFLTAFQIRDFSRRYFIT